MNADGRHRVLIVGGGTAGLCAAIALRNKDWDVDLVERDAVFAPLGAGVMLAPNAVKSFTALGVGAAVRKAGYWQQKCILRDSSGTIVGEIDVTQWTLDRINILRSDLHRILLQKAGPIRVRLGTFVEDIDAGDSLATVRFSDGSRDRYRLVVAADGYRSGIRARLAPQAGVVFAGHYAGQLAIKGSLADGWTWQLGSGHGRWLHASRISTGMVDLGAHIISDNPSERPKAGELSAIFKDFGPPLSSFLPALDDGRRVNPVFEAAQDTWAVGPVAFVGDAAHALPSILGQGTGMAAEDAIVLGQEIGSHDDLQSGLAAYRLRREARLVMLRALAHKMTHSLNAGLEGATVDSIAHLLWVQDDAVKEGP